VICEGFRFNNPRIIPNAYRLRLLYQDIVQNLKHPNVAPTHTRGSLRDELVVVSKRDRSNQACIYCSPHLEGFFLRKQSANTTKIKKVNKKPADLA